MIKQSRPWLTGGAKTFQGRQAVKWNKLQTGAQSAPVLEIKKLLYQTNNLLGEVAKLPKFNSSENEESKT